MTRVYQNPDATVGLRVLIVGAGAYPAAKNPNRLVLKDLTSVPPSALLLARKLLTDWRANLSQALVSIDLLLSDSVRPAIWPGHGAAGEIAAGSPLDPPTRGAIDTALVNAMAGATKDDGLLLLFCGHGVAKDERYFVPSDFGAQPNPWNVLINLDELALALRQEPPRTQWLFWDCCANIPEQILNALGTIGNSPLPRDAARLSAAVRTHGALGQFRLASAADGEEAFGIRNAPSRFMEMLVDAFDGAGCTRRIDRKWQVFDDGIRSAIQTYADRKAGLENPDFYRFVVPASTDTQQRMRFRELAGPPKSILIASSDPRPALKKATLAVARDGASIHNLPAPQQTAVLHLSLDPEREYEVTATFEDGAVQTKPSYAYLPLADPVEFARP